MLSFFSSLGGLTNTGRSRRTDKGGGADASRRTGFAGDGCGVRDVRSLNGVRRLSWPSSEPTDLAGLDLRGEPGRGTIAGSRFNAAYRYGASTDVVLLFDSNGRPNTDDRLGGTLFSSLAWVLGCELNGGGSR